MIGVNKVKQPARVLVGHLCEPEQRGRQRNTPLAPIDHAILVHVPFLQVVAHRRPLRGDLALELGDERILPRHQLRLRPAARPLALRAVLSLGGRRRAARAERRARREVGHVERLDKDLELDRRSELAELIAEGHLKALRASHVRHRQRIADHLAVGRKGLRVEDGDDKGRALEQLAAERHGDLVHARRARHPLDRVPAVDAVGDPRSRSGGASDVHEEGLAAVGEPNAARVARDDAESHDPLDRAHRRRVRDAAALRRALDALRHRGRDAFWHSQKVVAQTSFRSVTGLRNECLLYRGSAHSPTNAVLTTWNATP